LISELLLSAAFVLVSVLGLLFVRRRVPLEQLVEHHEVAGVCFAVVGGLYGIILAFVLVSSWERYETARAQTELEANAIANIYRHSTAFSEPTRSRLGNAANAYVKSVLEEEWPAMADGHPSDATQSRYFEVWQSVLEARPKEAWEVALYQSTLEELDEFADGRRDRIFYMQSGLPSTIWVFLVAFGAATVAFTYYFGMPRMMPQIVITVILAATIAWTLALVRETQNPFSGGLRVNARAFHEARHFMRGDSLEEHRSSARSPTTE
jgi:hypothetical protein